MSAPKLHFEVSTGLKTVLGSELITDDEVAVFELVKNSFDARATHVDLYFGDRAIVIADNGEGMTFDEIKDKWLFVAYSSKRDVLGSKDFRENIAERRHYAGSKGIGRFSSDRLGTVTVLQTRSKTEKSGPICEVTVEWERFDKDYKEHFQDVSVIYNERKTFDLPRRIRNISHGTVIKIAPTRQNWDRDRILKLKSGLAKLINPFGAAADGFSISIFAPGERKSDVETTRKHKNAGTKPPPNSLVNGKVGNFIFSTLREKTTFVDVRASGDGKHLESSLTDRGELIYRIREPNPYPHLTNSGFSCQVYFLNNSAKQTFSRRMGVPSVQFGSVFLFRNGFRVVPVGEEGDDWFHMDRRKQQGYARFLGTRDVIGRIEVSGADFQEPSSRNTGLIETPATEQLRECFMEYCLKRLERYVVPVTFIDKEDKKSDDVSRLLTDPGRARVTEVVAKLVDKENVELLDYSRRLVRILNERSEKFEESLGGIRAIAERTKDAKLFSKIEEAEQRFAELRRAEEAARRQADEERKAKEKAQRRAEKAERNASETTEALGEERKRNLFLTSIASLDKETILELHHQVTIYAVNVQMLIENYLVKISDQKTIPAHDVINILEGITLINRRVIGVAKFATKANFRMESESIEADLGEYISQYVSEVARDFLPGHLSVAVDLEGKGFVQKFKPIDVTIVIDNLIANARKAKATKVKFLITHPSRDSIHVRVTDNGRGFDHKIKDLSRIFEMGFTTTDGSGLGLFHVRQVLGEMNGTIEAVENEKSGAEFLIKVAR